jgi:acyl-CoA thioesterase FadM
MQPDFEAAALGSIKVLNQDTDFVGHMNNVAYVRDFANCFSASEWRKLAVTELEIHFRRPCFEGDVLEFYTGVRGEDGYVPVRAEAGGEVKALIRYK